MSLISRILYTLMYFTKPPWDTGVSPPELIRFMDQNSPERAIDLGCGTGTNVITMAKRGWEVTGVDFVPKAIHAARQKAKKAGIKADLRVGDVTRLEGIEGPYHLALDMGCFHSLKQEDQKLYMDKLTRILAPEGRFLLYVFFRNEDSSEPGVVEADLERIESRLKLVWRKDSTERGIRPAAWMEFMR
jgi:cyclopropane fatty-acyl-phospholipid synthase-like methyltransferase